MTENQSSQDIIDTIRAIIKPFDSLIDVDKNYKGEDIKFIFSKILESVEEVF